ncbi:MAG: PEP-CTERM sorting domain-containing protein [Phycisphaerae bacterium]|nr:PEP-CTERM sorting domain-containing protein [Phycisphaerae bacterium]
MMHLSNWRIVVAALVACGMVWATSAAVMEGAVYAWGSNSSGQLGDGTTTSRWSPTVISGLESGVTAVAAGATFGLAIQDGSLVAWGHNNFGQLGRGNNVVNASCYTPRTVLTMGSGVTVVATGNVYGLAVRDGALYSWGRNTYGELGVGNNLNNAACYTPRQVVGMSSDVTAIAGGTFHSLAIQNGALYAWGQNSAGQLGNGTQTDSYTPQPVSGMDRDVTAVAAGNSSSLAIQNGALYAWGTNSYGQLGVGDTLNNTDCYTPRLVTGMDRGVTAIASEGDTNMAVKDGHVYLWGRVADVMGSHYSTPQEVVGLTNIVEVAVCGSMGSNSYYALDADGALWAWGANNYGQLGIDLAFGTSTAVSTPQRVGGDQDLTFASFSVRNGFVLALQGTPVPEPASLLVLTAGAAGLLSRRRTKTC